VLIDSRYLIVEVLAEDEPKHYRARSRETGDLVSLFAYREANPANWINLWNRVSALPNSTRGIVLENFVFQGQRYVVTPALPPHLSLPEHLGKPRLLEERQFQTNRPDKYTRAQADFQRPVAAAPVQTLTRSQAEPRSVSAAAEAGLKTAASKLAVVPSELEIFEARTLRVDFDESKIEEFMAVATLSPQVVGGSFDFQVPPKPFATSMIESTLPSATSSVNNYVDEPKFHLPANPKSSISPLSFVLYGAGIAALVAATAAYFWR
jgi:hypothetical protein